MERYFEWETSGNKQDCVHYCSRCLGDTKKLTKRVNRQGVMSLLVQRVHGSDKDVTLRDLVRSMKESRKLFSTEMTCRRRELAKYTHFVCS